MYLDGKRIGIMVTTCVLALMAWYFKGEKNQNLYDRIEEMETGASSNPEKIAAAQKSYAEKVFEAMAKLKNNEFNVASLLLYNNYPPFENYLNAQGLSEIAPNLTLRQWHDQQSVLLIRALEVAYERAKQMVAQGDYSHQDMKDFLNHTPFPYIHKIKQRWRTDRREVESQRLKNAANWILVSVNGSMGSSAVYEEAVRKALTSKWPASSKHKLVFGGTMSHQEKQAAARVIQVSIEGDKVKYEFENSTDKRGSTTFHETLTTKFSLLSKNDSLPSTSWDQLSEIVAFKPAPEMLTVEFDRYKKNQQANFSDVLEKQKEDLIKEFEQQLSTIPVFALNR